MPYNNLFFVCLRSRDNTRHTHTSYRCTKKLLGSEGGLDVIEGLAVLLDLGVLGHVRLSAVDHVLVHC